MASPVWELADEHVERWADLDPVGATYLGIAGRDDRWADWSPDGHRAQADLARSTLARLAELTDTADADRVARLVMEERLGSQLALHDARTWSNDLNVIACPAVDVVDLFDLADFSTPEAAEAWATRLEAVPSVIDDVRASLQTGLDAGEPAARRQAERTGEQVLHRAAAFRELPTKATDEATRSRLEVAGERAAAAYDELGRWLTTEYAAAARTDDAVGRERYELLLQSFLGAPADVEEAYAWGWERVRELHDDMRRVGEKILPGAGLAQVLHHVEHESDFAVVGIDALRGWAQEHVDHMIDVFGRDHFDVAPPIRTCEVKAGPAGGAAAPHYVGPSEDGSRPGSVWYPDLGADHRYALWGQVTTANHEAVPGHHLQVAQLVQGGAEVTRFQSTIAWTSGHGEGWALYAERLCHELDLLDRPDAVLGYLSAAQLRAVRVVIDIGVHCGFPIPADAVFRPGTPWSWDVAFDLAKTMTGEDDKVLASEIDRYFGWPGQAPSYALGEREWLAARAAAQEAAGASFDAKAFHTAALDLGPVGLDILRSEVVRAVS
ncbi:MAG: DUF885 domain-containing protein [Actinomycetota bacterium]